MHAILAIVAFFLDFLVLLVASLTLIFSILLCLSTTCLTAELTLHRVSIVSIVGIEPIGVLVRVFRLTSTCRWLVKSLQPILIVKVEQLSIQPLSNIVLHLTSLKLRMVVGAPTTTTT